MNRENRRKQYEKGYYKTHECRDSFTCKVCGRLVVSAGAGSGHRNHCPNCLSSLHLDIEPGDREASQTDTVVFTITLTPNASHTLALLRELGALDETHIAPTYGEYLSDTETTYDGYRNPDGSIPEDLLYDAPDTRTVS